jgi:large subunit ribosomal protein L9
MNVILKSKIEKLGEAGEVKEVKDGYALNYLIPKGLAMEATPKNIRISEQEKKHQVAIKEKEKEGFLKLAEKLNSHSYTVSKRTGEEDKLFGAVTTQDIAEAIKAEGIEIDKKSIELEEPLKKLGVFQIPIKLHPQVKANVKVWVVKK